MAATTRSSRRREALITALLVIVGIVLAICMFAAGVLWRSRPARQSSFRLGPSPRQVPDFEIGRRDSVT